MPESFIAHESLDDVFKCLLVTLRLGCALLENLRLGQMAETADFADLIVGCRVIWLDAGFQNDVGCIEHSPFRPCYFRPERLKPLLVGDWLNPAGEQPAVLIDLRFPLVMLAESIDAVYKLQPFSRENRDT